MIVLQDVSFFYQNAGESGIKNISLRVKKGECLLLCGRSGCGKSTVTRLINGLIPHFYSGTLTGSVQVAGMAVAGTPVYAIAEKVGSVFQNPRSQFFNVDTDSEIAFALENMALPVAEISRRLQRTALDLNLEKLLGRSIFQLSGGEKQKIAFASVYALAPDIYVLDEPSANLDAQSIEELRALLKLLKRQGKTVVIAEHRLYYLKDIADRVVYMEKGHIEAEYTAASFWTLGSAERAAKGLRSMELEAVRLAGNNAGAGEAVLEICDLAIAWEKTMVVKNVNITAARGDVIGVTGGNGTGKSTFSQTLCGLRKEAAGRFLWCRSPVGPKQRLQLSYMVMQDVNYQLFAESVAEECLLGNNNPDESLLEKVLKQLSLYEYRECHPMSLSGGQKQRTAVAVSQLCNKEIIIFDEPTSGLDFGGMLQVSGLISALAAAGRVIFVVTHDHELIANTCSRLIRFADGAAGESPQMERKSGQGEAV